MHDSTHVSLMHVTAACMDVSLKVMRGKNIAKIIYPIYVN